MTVPEKILRVLYIEFLLIHGGWIVARYLPTLCVSQLLLLTMGLSRSSSSYILVGNRGSMLWLHHCGVCNRGPCIPFPF